MKKVVLFSKSTYNAILFISFPVTHIDWTQHQALFMEMFIYLFIYW